MKIKILGSAAAEGWPAIFCECDVCQTARRTRGKDVRRRTSYLIDDTILVDLGPDAFWQSMEFDVDLAKLDAVFFTHSHEDHCNPTELLWHRPGFSLVTRQLELFGDQAVIDKLTGSLEGRDVAKYKFNTTVLLPGQTIEFNGYQVTAVLANHAAPPEKPLNYIFRAPDGTAALIGNDSGWWCDETWQTVAQHRLDIAIIEGTMGLKNPDWDRCHLGVAASVRVRDRLAELGVLQEGAQVVVNHFSHNGGGSHQQLCDYFQPHGMHVGYDGLTLQC